MAVKSLICPLNEELPRTGPITRSFESSYSMSSDEMRLYRNLSIIPKEATKTETNSPDKKNTKKNNC